MSQRTLIFLMVGIFLAGLIGRWGVFADKNREGDEFIYVALLNQLDAGKGFTLQGSPQAEAAFRDGRLSPLVYDTPIFMHPPVGIVGMYPFWKYIGFYGLGLYQLVSFAVFYGAILAFVREVAGEPLRPVSWVCAAMLAAFSPIMAHVTIRFWLDGPLLMYASVGCWLFIGGVRRMSWKWLAGSVIFLALAAWVKITALGIVPGLFVLGLAIAPPGRFKAVLVRTIICGLLVSLLVLPWLIWQANVLGDGFPPRAGRPDDAFIKANHYLYLVTVHFSPWRFFYAIPMIFLTTIPALLLAGFAVWRDKHWQTARIYGALIFWCVLVMAVYTYMGFNGFSRVIRYVAVITPAIICLPVLLLQREAVWREQVNWAELRPWMRRLFPILTGLLLLAVLLESMTGAKLMGEKYIGIITPLWNWMDMLRDMR